MKKKRGKGKGEKRSVMNEYQEYNRVQGWREKERT